MLVVAGTHVRWNPDHYRRAVDLRHARENLQGRQQPRQLRRGQRHIRLYYQGRRNNNTWATSR